MKRWMALILAAAMVFADICVPMTVAATEMETEPTVVATTVATEETAAAVEETTVAAEETTVATEEIMDVAEDNVQSVEPAPVPAAFSGTCGYSSEFGDIVWFLDNGTLTISGEGEVTSDPWESYKEQITKVIISDGITGGAFSFRGYPAVTDVSIGMSEIGSMMFYQCENLTTVCLLSGVISIGSSAFQNCDKLTSVILPETLLKIDDVAFGYNEALTEIVIPDSVTTLGEYALYNCPNLTHVTLPSGLTRIPDLLLACCNKLTEINIPESVTAIGESAFLGCDNLTNIYVPSNVRSIGQEAFSPAHYANMQSITVSADNQYFSHDSYGALLNKDKTILYRVPSALNGTYVAPATVRTIEPWACNRCLYLTEIKLPDAIVKIGESAFANCCRLNKINIPKSLTVIESHSFSSCPLTELTFSENLVEIEKAAFSWSRYDDDPDGTSYLKELIIPANVKKIGPDAFKNMQSLEKVVFCGDAPETGLFYTWESGPFAHNSYKKCYYNCDNETFTDAAKEALGGDRCIWITIKPEPAVSVHIPDSEVCADPLICGTVALSNNTKNMAILMKIKPYETIQDLSLKFTLPDGFSFEKDSIVTEHVKQIGTLTQETTEPLPSIYPIYIGEENQTEDGKYCLTVEITGTDSTGTKSRTDELVFYRPVATRNVAQSLTSFDADDYEFSLDSATGNGSIYNQETARLCAILSDIAYEYDKVETFWSQLGFSNSLMFAQASMHEVLRYYASKQIIKDGKIQNVVYVVLRGTTSLSEWASNLVTGVRDMHHGFTEASECVQKELKDYCKLHKFAKENTIIVVTGHSRGAAVANIVGHWLNSKAELANKENVSVYTFATPTVDKSIISEEAGYVGNENIFNFVNYQDAIRNAPSMQHYGRYGSTRIFAFETASTGATEHNDGYQSYPLPKDGANYTLNEIVNAILYITDTGSPVSVTWAIAEVARLVKHIAGIYPDGDSSSDKVIGAHEMKHYYNAVVKNASDASFASVNARTSEAYGYYLSYLGILGDFKYLIHSFHCPIDLYVYNESGETVASIVDGHVMRESENLLVYVDGESLNVGYSEEDRDKYTLEVVGYDDGTMQHCLQTVGADSLESIQLRENIPITNGGVLEVNDSGYVGLAGESEAEILAAYEIYEEEDEMEWVLENLEPRELTVDDAIYLVWHTLFPEMYPVVERAVDYNGDGEVTDADAVVLLWHILFPDEYSLT